MTRLGGFDAVEDTRSLPGVEWMVDRERAARHGAGVALLGQAVQMTTGLTAAIALLRVSTRAKAGRPGVEAQNAAIQPLPRPQA